MMAVRLIANMQLPSNRVSTNKSKNLRGYVPVYYRGYKSNNCFKPEQAMNELHGEMTAHVLGDWWVSTEDNSSPVQTQKEDWVRM